MAIKPRTYVSAPAFTPLPYGLLSALSDQIRVTSDSHWQAGVIYESICAIGNTTYDECFSVSGTGAAPVAPPPSKTATTEYLKRGATPFTVYTELDCSVPGFWERSLQDIHRSFNQSEQYQVESAFWTGLAAGRSVVFPHLAANTEIVDEAGTLLQSAAQVTATPTDIVTGLGDLESSLAACYDGIGVIHAPRSLAPEFASQHLLTFDGTHYRTTNGNIVVFGSGYSGSAPDGSVSTTSAYMYATGAIFIYRSDIYTINGVDALDRANNLLKPLVERNYLIGWDCCHVGVNITLGEG